MLLLSRPITIKEVWTTHSRQYNVNPYWTIRQFMETLSPHLTREFNCLEFDLIESGQDLPGIPAEAGLPLQISDIQLINKWGQQLNVALYLRRRNIIYPQLQNLNINIAIHSIPEMNPIITNSVSINQCPVCYENVPLLNRYSCRHCICTNCYYQCLNTNNIRCSICRSV